MAEPGCTAEGDYATMVQLLETAHACGADVFKPQWTSDPDAMVTRRKVREVYRRYYGWLHWPVDWHQDFRDRCRALGMQYACSVYLPQDVATVAPFVDYLKIASFEAQDKALRIAFNKYRRVRKPIVLVSCGAGFDGDVDGWNGETKRLHCVSAYPADLGAMNLACLRGELDDDSCWARTPYDGLSDHSRHLLAGALAVALGADIVETHYRLDACDPTNPDYVVAFTPVEFAAYIQNIRDAELMLGSGVKQIQDCERAMMPYRVVS